MLACWWWWGALLTDCFLQSVMVIGQVTHAKFRSLTKHSVVVVVVAFYGYRSLLSLSSQIIHSQFVQCLADKLTKYNNNLSWCNNLLRHKATYFPLLVELSCPEFRSGLRVRYIVQGGVVSYYRTGFFSPNWQSMGTNFYYGGGSAIIDFHICSFICIKKYKIK